MSDPIEDCIAQARGLLGDDLEKFLCTLPNNLQTIVRNRLAEERADEPTALVPTPPKTITVAPSDMVQSDYIGPYKILQPIGQGGMGQVFMAEQVEPVKRRVALKVIKTETPSKEILARFEAERQALAMMDHQNIAKVLDAGITENGRPYFAMELVKGVPITEYCDKNKLTPNERLGLFVQTCRAIQHAHMKGIIHRDIKPSNVLVTLYDGKPVAKVIDFGLAKALQDQVQLANRTLFTQYGQVVGTLAYMSPEQAEMNTLDVDTRTDVYSLGVIFYELLTGTTPITRDRIKTEAFDRILALIREQEVPRLSQRLSDSRDQITGISEQRRTDPKRLSLILKGDLDWIAVKALEKDRTRRYDTPSTLADDVQRYLSGEAIEARPPSLIYRLQKVARRHRAGFAVALVAAVLLTATSIITSTLWFKSSKAEEVAQIETRRAKLAETKMKIARDNAREANQQTLSQVTRLRRTVYADALQAVIYKSQFGNVEHIKRLLGEAQRHEENPGWEFRFVRSIGLARSHDTTILHELTRSDSDSWTNHVVDFSDLESLVISKGDGSIEIRNSSTGEVTAAKKLAESPISGIARIPNREQPSLYASTESGDFLEVAVPSMDVLSQLKITGGIAWFCVSPNGTIVAVVDKYQRKSIVVRPAGRKRFQQEFVPTETQLTVLIAESPSSFLAATAAGKIVRLETADTQSGIEVSKTWQPNCGEIRAMTLLNNGLFVVAGAEACVRVFDPNRGKVIAKLLTGTAAVSRLRLNSDQSQLAVAGESRTITVIDLETYTQRRIRQTAANYYGVADALFIGNEATSRLVTTTAELRFDDLYSSSSPVSLDGIPRTGFKPVDLDVTGHTLVISINDPNDAQKSGLQIANLTTAEAVFRGGFHARFATVNPQGTRIALNFTHNTKQPLQQPSAPDGNWVNATVLLKKENDWKPSLLGIQGNKNPLVTVCFAPGTQRMASVDAAGAVHIWDTATEKLVFGPTDGLPSEGARNVAFYDDRTIVVSQDDALCVFTESLGAWQLTDARKASRPRGLRCRENVLYSLARDGIASYRLEEGTLIVCENNEERVANSAKEFEALRARLGGSLVDWELVGDLSILATSAGNIIVWDMKHQMELFAFETSQGGVKKFSLLDDGSLITCGRDGTIKIWPLK